MSGSDGETRPEWGDVCQIPTSRMGTDLLRSHLLVAAIAVSGLLAATGALAWLKWSTSHSLEVLHSEISQAVQLQAEIERTMVDLRTWMLSGEEEYKHSRHAAWSSALGLLEQLEHHAEQSDDRDDSSRLLGLRDTMRELKYHQWWIEDRSLTPGIRPAESLLAARIDPIAERIFRGITATIDFERSMPSADRRQLLADMADFRGFFTRSHAMLISVVYQFGDVDVPSCLDSLKVAEERVASLVEQQVVASEPQRELIAMLSEEMLRYQGLANQIIKVVQSQDSSLSEMRYATQAAPLAEKSYRILTTLIGRKTYEMQTKQDFSSIASGWIGVAVFALACGLSALAGVLSYRRAKAIAGPIQTLCKATQEIADGKLDRDLPVITNDEVAILTHNFNAMRHALRERTESLLLSNEEILQQQQRFETLIEYAPIAMVMIDADRKLTMVNREGRQLFGYREDELLGKVIEVLIPERFRPTHPEKVADYFQEPEKRELGGALELFGLKKDGTEFPVELGLRPLQVDGQLQVLSVIVDNSKRKEIESLEKQLAQAHRLEAIGQLAAGVAHEINTPMQFILSNVDYVKDVFPMLWGTIDQLCELFVSESLPADVSERMSEAEAVLTLNSIDRLKSEVPSAMIDSLEGIARVVEIVQAMKQMAHPGSEEKTLGSVNSIARSAVTVTSNRWKYVAQVEFDLDDSLPEIYCYPGDLNRVLVNLIVNAADAISDFQPESAEPLGRITVRTLRDEETVRLEVADNGGGVPEKIVHKIFDPFFTTKEVGSGSGQGLAICYDVIVKRHGGQIECVPTQEVGTTFRISLPISQETPSPIGMQEEPNADESECSV